MMIQAARIIGRTRVRLRFVRAPLMFLSKLLHDVFRRVGLRRVHGRHHQRLYSRRDVADGRAWSVRGSSGTWFRHFPSAPLHSASQGLIRIAAVTLVIMAAVGLPLSVSAGVIAGSTGIAETSDGNGAFVFHLGSGLSGNLNSVYIRLGDNGQTGYLTQILFYECTTGSYNSPGALCGSGAYRAVTAVGGTTGTSVALTPSVTGLSSRTVRLDFSIHNSIGDTGVGVNTPIVLDPTKFYAVVFSATQNATSPYGASRSVFVHGIEPVLTDASGNRIYCKSSIGAYVADACGTEFGTPYHLITDIALTQAELDSFNGSTTSFNNWLVPTAPPNSSSYGFVTGASVSEGTFGKLGNMLSGIAVFLFSPWDDATANAWVNFKNSLTVHIPMSYIAEVNTMVSSATVASGSIPTVSIGGLGAINVSTVSFFSSATITSYAPPGLLVSLRTIAVAGLWLALLWHMYQTTKHLFG